MKCTNCGHELEPGSGFCEHCGMIMSLDGAEDKTEKVSEAKDDSFEYIEQNQPEQEQNEDNSLQPEHEEHQPEADETAEAVYEDISSGTPMNEETQQNPEEEEKTENTSVFEDGETRLLYSEPEETQSEPEKPQEQVEETQLLEPNEPEEEKNDDGLDEMLVTSKGKSKKGSIIVAALIVVLIAVVAGGVSVIRGNFKPAVNTSSNLTTSSQNANAVDPTTKKETTEKETTTEETTEETTKKDEKTTKDETTKSSSSASTSASSRPAVTANTTARTTSRSTTSATRASYTTRPSTTRAQTTAKAQTTTKKPSTTAKQTTKAPSTSNKYDVVSVKPQKPATYLSKSYTGYVTVNGVHMRSGPSASSAHILYFSIGADVKVLASQNGFLYVYSNRYGVYGWINASNVSKTRPESSSQTTVPGLVKPDKTYSSAKTMYVNTKEGLRLRKGPGSSYDVIRMISNGYPVSVKGYSSTASGWVYVTDTTHGVSGWVSSAYLK